MSPSSRVAEEDICDKDEEFLEHFIIKLTEDYAKDGVYFYPSFDFVKLFNDVYEDIYKQVYEDIPAEKTATEKVKALKRLIVKNGFSGWGKEILNTLLNIDYVNFRDNWIPFDEGVLITKADESYTVLRIRYDSVQIEEGFKESALAVVVKGLSDRIVKTEINSILANKIDNETFKKLVESYTAFDELDQNAREDIRRKYVDFLRALKSFYNQNENELPDDAKKAIKHILENLNYEGKRFPIFPGAVSEVCKFFRLSCDEHYAIPYLCQGFNVERNTIYYLLKLRKFLKSNNSLKTLKRLLDEFLQSINLDWLEFEEYENLFDESFKQAVVNALKELLQQYDGVYSLIYDSKSKGSKSKLEVRITPSPRDVKELFVFLITNGKIKNEHLFNEFLATICANTNYYPEKINVFHQEINYALSKEKKVAKNNKGVYEFIYSLKATLDSAILYLLITSEDFRDKVKCDVYKRFDEGKNYWFIVILNRDEENTLIHDYYYHILDGLTNFELLTKRSKNILKQQKRLNKVRSLFNVQLLTYLCRSNGREKEIVIREVDSDEFRVVLGEPIELYRFKRGGSAKVYRLKPKTDDKLLYLSKKIVDTKYLRSNPEKNKAKAMSDDWIYVSSSMKNTSTASYKIEPLNINRIFTLSVEQMTFIKEKVENEYVSRILYNVKLCEYNKDGRENVLIDEFFLDDPYGKLPEAQELAMSFARNLIKDSKDSTVIVKIAHAPKSGERHITLIESFVNFVKGVKHKNIIGFVDNIAFTPINNVRGKDYKVKVLSTKISAQHYELNGELNCLFVYGKTNDKKKTYLRPSALFGLSEIPHDILACCCLGDERHEGGITGLKRLFSLPYPDTVKNLIRPGFFIKGVNVVIKDGLSSLIR
jgi:hypothetical protein